MAAPPNCQHCNKPMAVNKYVKVGPGQESYTFACYACGTVNIKTYPPPAVVQRELARQMRRLGQKL